MVRLHATSSLCGPLLIRAGQDEAVTGPDVQHLHARQADGKKKPVLAGTSLAGVLRHRAERIVHTLQPDNAGPFVKELFGSVEREHARASRIRVHEHVLDHTTDLVQNRIAVDRFTGGAYDGALFSEQPIFCTPENVVTLTIEIDNPDDAEIGMLLLLLKDLWTGDLPVGGESSIGRGRLRGKTATLTRQQNGSDMVLARIEQRDQQLHLAEGQQETLQKYVAALCTALQKEEPRATTEG
jgi:CRISPR/Cas system CSM-associated protein Csm3 (group 7 of RAMP superfamily)